MKFLQDVFIMVIATILTGLIFCAWYMSIPVVHVSNATGKCVTVIKANKVCDCKTINLKTDKYVKVVVK